MPYGELYLPPILPESPRKGRTKDGLKASLVAFTPTIVAENELEGERYTADSAKLMGDILNVSHTTICKAIQYGQVITRGKLAGFRIYRL